MMGRSSHVDDFGCCAHICLQMIRADLSHCRSRRYNTLEIPIKRKRECIGLAHSLLSKDCRRARPFQTLGYSHCACADGCYNERLEALLTAPEHACGLGRDGLVPIKQQSARTNS